MGQDDKYEEIAAEFLQNYHEIFCISTCFSLVVQSKEGERIYL